MAPRPFPGVLAVENPSRHAAADVRHPRPAVERQDFQSDRLSLFERPQDQLAPLRVLVQVRGDLGDDDRHAAAARFVEAQPLGHRPGNPPGLAGLRRLIELEYDG